MQLHLNTLLKVTDTFESLLKNYHLIPVSLAGRYAIRYLVYVTSLLQVFTIEV